MIRRILTVIMVLSLVFVVGCSELNLTQRPSGPSHEIVRKATLGSKWQMYQIRIDEAAGEELTILLKLVDGDKVDGYFYLEKGNNVDFQITANSLIYKSQPQDVTKGISSDRFAFTASTTQGISYTLTFRNTASADEKQAKTTIFLEVIYPATASIFTPLDKK